MLNEPTDKPSYLNQSYRDMRRAWRIVDDVAQGTLRLRAAGSEYLPIEPAEDERDFKIRLERAIFFNAFERSLHGLVGMVFRKEPRLGQDVSEFIRGSADTEGIAENVDNLVTHWIVLPGKSSPTPCGWGMLRS